MEKGETITVGATRSAWSPGVSQNTLCIARAGRRRFWLKKLFAICLVLGLSLAAALFLALALRPAVAVQAINASLAPVRASAPPASARVSPDFQAQGLNLDVHYGADRIEIFCEAGHTVWITVTEGDGHTIKATTVLTTGAVPGWSGQAGFWTSWQGWSPRQPDIVPGDWVYGLVDSGYAATVHVGTITGDVDMDTDSISGTIHADWFTQTLNAYCSVGEENGPGFHFTVDPDGGTYLCDFSSQWDLLPGQTVGVNYEEPDGDWVIGIFQEPWLTVRVNQSHNWVQGETTRGSTIVATVWRGGLPVLANATTNGSGSGWNINFCCGDESQLRVGDVIEVQTSQGPLASIEIIPMDGVVDAGANTISGQLSGVPFPAKVRGEIWAPGGPSVEGRTDSTGNYRLDFSPFDVFPDHMVALWYVRPDGHQVGIVRHALRLNVDVGRDRVDGNIAPGIPVKVMLSNGETLTTTSDASGNFGLDFASDIAPSDAVEAWAGAQHTRLVVVPVTAEIDDAGDKVWGQGPPNSKLGIAINGDWRWEIPTDGSGNFEFQYDRDITPNDSVEVQYDYPTGHQTRYAFGLPNVRVNQWRPVWNVERGKEYRYFIEYANDANGLATDVVVTDTLPYSVTYLRDTSGVTPTFDPGSRTIAWRLGRLGAYRSKTFELWVTLDSDVPPGTQLRSRVEISASGDRDPNNNWSETDVWPSDPYADTWADKSFDGGLPIPGEVITYQLNYGNNGNRMAHDVILSDTLPAGTTFVTSTFRAGVDGLAEYVSTGVVTWQIEALPPGQSRQFKLALRIDDAAAPGTLLADEVTIRADDDGGELRDNRFWHTTVVAPLVPDLWVDTAVEGDLASVDNEIIYRITYRNDGTSAAEDVVVTGTLPTSLAHLWHSAESVATLADGTVVWRLGTVPPGSGGSLLVGARASRAAPAGTVFTNTVEASTSTPELDYENNRAVTALGPPRVVCVPWAGAQPHRVWPGLDTTLKGTARGDGLAGFEWDPGDGSPAIEGTVGDPHAIEARHTYNAPPGTLYTATLTVWGAFGWSGTDTYLVQVFTSTHGAQVDEAIDEGLWYIHKAAWRYEREGLPFAEWGGGNRVAEIASAVQAFQVQGHLPGGDAGEDPYVEDVQAGWNTLFTYARPDPITPQPAGDPDSDGDGVGIGMYDNYGAAIYESGLAMMALATTGAADQVARTGPPIYVRGQTYYSITQDVADWFAWGQNDLGSGSARGGWRYRPNSGDSDNSNTQFPVLGLAAAEENWGITVPTWVRDELRDRWLAYTQGSSGGFGYGGPDDWNNVGKTGAGIMDLTWTGVPVTGTRIVRATGFIEAHWDDQPDGNWNGNLGEFYAMYAVKKGSQLADIYRYGSHYWDYEYGSYLIGVQQPDGRFDDAGSMAAWQPMNTSWAVMILSPGLYQALPVPIVAPMVYGGVGAGWGNGAVEFDASESHHTDPIHAIVLFEWDFGDGSPIVTTTNPIATHTYLTRGIYVATLTAWDDAGRSTTKPTQVNVTAPDSPPVADPGGPYSSLPGQGVVLDGSSSYDPDKGLGDAVTLYEWDIAGSKRTTGEPTLAYTGTVTGTFPVVLRVKDRGTDYGPDSPKWSEPVTTTLVVGKETPLPPEEQEPQGAGWLVWVVLALSSIIVAVFLIPRAIGRLRA